MRRDAAGQRFVLKIDVLRSDIDRRSADGRSALPRHVHADLGPLCPSMPMKLKLPMQPVVSTKYELLEQPPPRRFDNRIP